MMKDMKKRIIPAILPKDFFDLEKHLERASGATDFVQIDICDGKFTQSKTWPYTHTPDIYFEKMLTGEEGMPFWKELDFELDLMIREPELVYEQFLQLGSSRMIFHFATLKNPLEFLKKVKEENFVEVGLAFDNDARATNYPELLEMVDVVQCMGISKVGFQGQPFDERVLDQVRDLKKTYPEKIIAVDGSVNENTLELLRDAGVDHFVMGSAFFKQENLIDAFYDFEDIVNPEVE